MEKQCSANGRLSLLDVVRSLSLPLRRNHVTDYLRSGRPFGRTAMRRFRVQFHKLCFVSVKISTNRHSAIPISLGIFSSCMLPAKYAWKITSLPKYKVYYPHLSSTCPFNHVYILSCPLRTFQLRNSKVFVFLRITLYSFRQIVWSLLARG